MDLERQGKAERQEGRPTWISPHSLDDVEVVGHSLRRAHLFARINPVHRHSSREIEALLASGVDVIMAPMIGSADEACEFASIVAGRACTVALVEVRAGLDALPAIAAVEGLSEIHVGINDLALSLNLPNRWAVLAGDLLSDAAACAREAGKPFGFGGIGRAHDSSLPIPSDLVYAEYARTGSTRALVARSFGASCDSIGADISSAFARLAEWRAAPAERLAAAHAELGRCVAATGAW